MNELIEELLKKSLTYQSHGPGEITTVDYEKFAELIVRECAEIAKTAEPWRSDDLILKHFGLHDERR